MDSLTNIRWIAFDAVGTLIYPEPSVTQVYHQIGRQHGSQLSRDEVHRRFRAAMQRATDHKSSEETEFQFWQSLVGEVLDDASDPHRCFTELHDWFAAPSAWGCFDEVASVLESLQSRGYKLAIASNFDARLHTVRRGLPGLQLIDVCVVSSEVGWRKPHPGFYRALAETCGCEPAEILMVGDDWTNDLLGAEQAGLRAVWLDRGGAGAGPNQATRSISSLMGLNQIVAGSDQETGKTRDSRLSNSSDSMLAD